jgi:hypothetical protein
MNEKPKNSTLPATFPPNQAIAAISPAPAKSPHSLTNPVAAAACDVADADACSDVEECPAEDVAATVAPAVVEVTAAVPFWTVK